MPFLIDDEWARRLPKMWRWMRNFRIEGPGVSAKNTDETFTASITSQSLSRIQATPSIAIVKITGNATGAGKYTGRAMTTPTATPNTTSAVAEADVGVAPASDDCYVFNMHEIYTSAGHALYTAGSQPQVIKYWFAVKHPKAASDGKPIYLIGGTDIYGCG